MTSIFIPTNYITSIKTSDQIRDELLELREKMDRVVSALLDGWIENEIILSISLEREQYDIFRNDILCLIDSVIRLPFCSNLGKNTERNNEIKRVILNHWFENKSTITDTDMKRIKTMRDIDKKGSIDHLEEDLFIKMNNYSSSNTLENIENLSYKEMQMIVEILPVNVLKSLFKFIPVSIAIDKYMTEAWINCLSTHQIYQLFDSINYPTINLEFVGLV